MLRRIWVFVTGTILIGFLALLPIRVIWLFFRWILGLIADSVSPISGKIVEHISFPGAEIVTGVFVALLICFAVGLLMKTRAGDFFYKEAEKLLKKIPFYSSIREIAGYLFKKERSLFLAFVSVELVPGRKVRRYGFQTDTVAADGMVSVLFLSIPDPTKGEAYRFPAEEIEKEPFTVREGLQLVLSGLSGYSKMLAQKTRQ